MRVPELNLDADSFAPQIHARVQVMGGRFDRVMFVLVFDCCELLCIYLENLSAIGAKSEQNCVAKTEAK